MSDATSRSNIVSTEDVESSRDRVKRLREELAAVNAEMTVSEMSYTNAARKARLDREAVSLEREIEEARRRLEISQGVEVAASEDDQLAASSAHGEANVDGDTGEVNPEEVERLTSYVDED